jgi:membrane protein
MLRRMGSRLDTIRSVTRATLATFSRRGGRLLGGALAFYAMLSVAPLLVIALQVAGVVTSERLARDALLENLTHYIGDTGAATLGALMERVQRPGAGWRGALSAAVLVYASTRLFSQLERALDHLWELPEPPLSFLASLRQKLAKRLFNFALVLSVGVLLVGLVLLKLVYDGAMAKLGLSAPVGWRITEAIGSLTICTLVFAALFRFLPSARFPWRHALLGAAVTASAFSVGAYAISAYLSHKSLTSTYGDAASIVVLLLWVHYSAQIFLLGAAFTGEWVRRHGGFVLPKGTPPPAVEDEAAASEAVP